MSRRQSLFSAKLPETQIIPVSGADGSVQILTIAFLYLANEQKSQLSLTNGVELKKGTVSSGVQEMGGSPELWLNRQGVWGARIGPENWRRRLRGTATRRRRRRSSVATYQERIHAGCSVTDDSFQWKGWKGDWYCLILWHVFNKQDQTRTIYRNSNLLFLYKLIRWLYWVYYYDINQDWHCVVELSIPCFNLKLRLFKIPIENFHLCHSSIQIRLNEVQFATLKNQHSVK